MPPWGTDWSLIVFDLFRRSCRALALGLFASLMLGACTLFDARTADPRPSSEVGVYMTDLEAQMWADLTAPAIDAHLFLARCGLLPHRDRFTLPGLGELDRGSDGPGYAALKLIGPYKLSSAEFYASRLTGVRTQHRT